MSQILWNFIKKEYINKLVTDFNSVLNYKYSIKCNHLIENIEIITDKKEYQKLLLEKYNLEVIKERKLLLYYVSIEDKNKSKGYIYYSDTEIVAFIFGYSFGYLKTVINGLVSLYLREFDFFPIHGAIFSIDNKSVLIIGSSGAGKSYSLIQSLFKYGQNRKVEILTDDWAFLQYKHNSLVAKSIDNSVSIEKKYLEQIKNLLIDYDLSLKRFINRNKSSFSKNDFNNIEFLNEIEINEIYILENKNDCDLETIDLVFKTMDFFPFKNELEKYNYKIFLKKIFSSLPINRIKFHSLDLNDTFPKK